MFQTKVAPSLIHGSVAPGFEEVEQVFQKNFSERGELGAACAVYHQGQKVVDLWGGYRDAARQAPWEENTLVLVFSVTKGMAAMTMALAHSQGLFDYDEPVAAYWPEFAQRGKEHITIRQLLSHQAGLCIIDEPLNASILADLDAVAAILARQKPVWEPGTKQGYHYLSLGLYEGELIRRVDPQHRSLGHFFQDEIAQPLGLEFYIGLPAAIPTARVAPIKGFHALEMVFHMDAMPLKMVMAYMNPNSLTRRTLGNPSFSSPAEFDRPEYRAVELSAAGGIGQVRSLARAYSVFALGGKELGLTQETWEALTTPATTPQAGLHDEVMHVNMRFSLGFFKPSSTFDFGSSIKAFGIPGAGGAFAYADPDAQLGFAYAPNKMGFYPWNDPRDKALREALDRSLKKMGGSFIRDFRL
jgi:CubicO group peptidase (beta-lactamase class C family)